MPDMHIDIEKLAREADARVGGMSLYVCRADLQMARDKAIATLVLEEAAKVASQHDHPGAGNAYSTAASRIANQLQIMSNQLKGNHD